MDNLLEESVCMPCPAGLHEECFHTTELDEQYIRCCCYSEFSDEAETIKPSTGLSKVRSLMAGEDMKDVLSTGRKRAARDFPIVDGMICEWAGLKRAGGGVVPIVGCNGNILYKERGKYARHHGPDKNTLNNSPGNIHRICPACHNRWHAANDKYYGERPPKGAPFLPIKGEFVEHDPETKFSLLDYITAENEWKDNREVQSEEFQERLIEEEEDDGI